jgi:hypothetical protein
MERKIHPPQQNEDDLNEAFWEDSEGRVIHN